MQIDSNVEVTLPNWQNLKDTFKITPFQDTKVGKRLLNRWDRNVKIVKWIKIIGIILSSTITVLVIIQNGADEAFNAIVMGLIIYLFFYLIYKIYKKTMVRITQKRYFKKRNAFTFELANAMLDYFHGGNFYVFKNSTCFIYNQNMCIFINANEGSWIGFHKNNITEVELEHVHLGSTTKSNTTTSGSAYAWTNNYASYSGSSTTVSNTTTHYEWRLDIYTDFIDFPHLTIVFPDDNDGETYAKKAKALLKY